MAISIGANAWIWTSPFTTDNEGRYEIAELPASRYRLQISKAGYVTLEYGQARPFESGPPPPAPAPDPMRLESIARTSMESIALMPVLEMRASAALPPVGFDTSA